ncbi:DUF1289 domain-containing protein [Mongoliimonas terrestris]|uniref:DUF1289 domain-containing protein n=1 Tax=Mongoliimonas terrestris TaxID=1709001 RepID=UPI001FD8F4D7|nr:DUF1289 domain-containing protein [Mongoliimonas terrestris]
MTTASTPCVKTCIIDPVSRLCVGCWRTLDEIGGWSRMSEPERLAVMAVLPARAGRPHTGGAPGIRR